MTRVVNVSNGHRYKFNQAKRLVEDQCVLKWEIYGVSVRELTLGEMVQARSEQARKRQLELEVLGLDKDSGELRELHGIRFVAPPTTTYQQPWAAYEEMEAPMGVRYCRWPRREAA